MVYKEESIMRIGIVSNWTPGCASTSRSVLTYCVMEQILRSLTGMAVCIEKTGY